MAAIGHSTFPSHEQDVLIIPVTLDGMPYVPYNEIIESRALDRLNTPLMDTIRLYWLLWFKSRIFADCLDRFPKFLCLLRVLLNETPKE